MADTTTRGVDAAYPPATDPADGREAALRALAREIDSAAPGRPRRRLVVAVATGAVAVTLVGAGAMRLVLPGDGGQGIERADAATVRALETVAVVAERSDAGPVIGPGDYLFTRSIAVNQVIAEVEGSPTTYLVRYDRRSWLTATGGRIREEREPVGLLAGDRAFWESEARRLRRTPVEEAAVSGLTSVAGRFAEVGAPDTALAERFDDPEAAAALLRDAASRYGGKGAEEQMFVMVGDGLRETDLSPRARAALFRAAAYIDGVRSLGAVRDSRGREGIGIAREADGIRSTLIFDPATSDLLEERETTTGPVEWLPGVPPGTVIGRHTHLERAVVDSATAVP